MKRKYTRHKRTVDPMANIVENLQMINQLLPKLALKVVEIEEIQHRFRQAVFVRLSRIDTVATMIHGAQIAETHQQRPGAPATMEKHAKEAEEEIERHSTEMGIKMVEYIYGKSEFSVRPHGRKKDLTGLFGDAI